MILFFLISVISNPASRRDVELFCRLGASGPATKFAHFALDIAAQRLYVAANSGQVRAYDWGAQELDDSLPSLPGSLIDLRLAADHSPVLLGVHPAALSVEGSLGATLTITGFNFGLRDGDGRVLVGALPCISSRWVSDRTFVCGMPEVTDSFRGKSAELGFEAGQGSESRTAEWASAVRFLKDSWNSVAPVTGLAALPSGETVTVTGRGFLVPTEGAALYRAAFRLEGTLLLSEPPVAATSTALVFDVPILLREAPAAPVQLLLLHGGGDLPAEGPTRGVLLTAIDEPSVVLEEAFGVLAVSEAGAVGGGALDIPGLGFRADALYSCRFSAGEHQVVTTSAVVATPRLLSCSIPRWSFAQGTVALSVLREDGNGPGIRLAIAHGEFGMEGGDSMAFKFTHSWTSLVPSHGSIAGGTRILLSGIGFDQAQPYFCLLTGTGAGGGSALLQATVLGTEKIRCVTTKSAGISVGLHANVTLLIGAEPVPHLGPGYSFDFQPAWVSLTPSTALAVGGTVITAAGIGIDPTLTYTCVLSINDNSERVYGTVIPAMGASEAEGLGTVECVVPEWTHPQGSGTVFLEAAGRSGLAAVFANLATGEPAVFPFTITGAVAAIEPAAAFARDRTLFALEGVGFDPASAAYQCLFSAPEGSLTVTASANSATSMQCAVEAWTFEAAEVEVEVLDGGVPLQLLERLTITFLQSFSALSPASIPASGAILYLRGAGFRTDSQYACKFSLGGLLVMQTPATIVNRTLANCVLSTWPTAHGKASVSLQWLAGGVAVAALGDRSLDVTDRLSSLSSSSLSAFGAELVNVSGWGFALGEASAYELELRLPNTPVALPPDSVAPCTALDYSTLSCKVPRWRYAAVTSQVLLVDRVAGSRRLVPGVTTLEFWTELSGSLVPEEAGAGNSTHLSLLGAGLHAAQDYECLFFDTHSGNEEPVARTPAVAAAPGLLHCSSPMWTLPAGRAQVQVIDVASSENKVILPVRGHPLVLLIRPQLMAITPDRGPLQGLSVTLMGVAFDTSHLHRCVIPGEPELPTVFPTNISQVVCQLPPRVTGDKDVRIGIEDVTASWAAVGTVAFSYQPGLLALSPSEALASGGVRISLEGRGFETDESYRCAFSSPSGHRVLPFSQCEQPLAPNC